jgi:hypothetical protein
MHLFYLILTIAPLFGVIVQKFHLQKLQNRAARVIAAERSEAAHYS